MQKETARRGLKEYMLQPYTIWSYPMYLDVLAFQSLHG